jgi:toxin ParE1/3/4
MISRLNPPAARIDLQGIHDFIAGDNVDAASSCIEKFFITFELLCHQPGMGRKRDEVIPGCQSFIEGEYVILCQPMSDDALEIKRVIHSKRDLRKALQ